MSVIYVRIFIWSSSEHVCMPFRAACMHAFGRSLTAWLFACAVEIADLKVSLNRSQQRY